MASRSAAPPREGPPREGTPGEAPAPRALPGRAAPAAPPGPVRLGPLGDTIGFQLRAAQEMAFAAFARRVGDAGLKPGRYSMLGVIRENPGLSQTALGAAVGRDKSTLTPALAELERLGLVRRDRGVDRRSYALTLTPAGEAALATLSAHAALHERALDRIADPGRDAFLETLRRLVAGLDTDAP